MAEACDRCSANLHYDAQHARVAPLTSGKSMPLRRDWPMLAQIWTKSSEIGRFGELALRGVADFASSSGANFRGTPRARHVISKQMCLSFRAA